MGQGRWRMQRRQVLRHRRRGGLRACGRRQPGEGRGVLAAGAIATAGLAAIGRVRRVAIFFRPFVRLRCRVRAVAGQRIGRSLRVRFGGQCRGHLHRHRMHQPRRIQQHGQAEQDAGEDGNT